MDFTDKRVLVTGSSRGIGFAIAEAFVDAGARVAINGKTEQSVSTAIEKLASGERLVAAPGDIGTVAGCESVVETASDAFGELATSGELSAGASALRAGASQSDLEELRSQRSGELTVAAGVLADLVAVGVPADTAIAAVLVLALGVDDSDYVAFRRNIERDIELGASPASALDIRLRVASELAADAAGSAASQTGTTPRRRKP